MESLEDRVNKLEILTKNNIDNNIKVYEKILTQLNVLKAHLDAIQQTQEKFKLDLQNIQKFFPLGD